MLKPWLCGSQQIVENSSKDGNSRPPYLFPKKPAGQEATVRTRHEQETGFKLGKKYVKAVYCHPAYLTYMQSTSRKMPGWMKHKLESRLPGKISITSDMQMSLRKANEGLRHYLTKCQNHTPPVEEIFPKILWEKREEQCDNVNIMSVEAGNGFFLN